MASLPFRSDTASVDKVNLHIMRAWDDLEVAVSFGRFVHADVGCDVVDLSDVVICWGVRMGQEAVAVGAFVVDFVFEEKHVLVIMLAVNISGILDHTVATEYKSASYPQAYDK
jgi:hypothetical protein